MRKNVTLKAEWQRKIKWCDEYEINICMICCDDELTLNVFLDLDGETSVDYECVMMLKGVEEPTSEMLKKFKSLVKYFETHFKNVNSNNKIIYV